MGAVDTPERASSGKGKGLHRPKRRVRVRIDMTPMVDVAFLLLIFFMVTTVFRKPQAMEVNLPPEGAKVAVPQSNVMMLYVRADQKIYYRMGTGGISSTAKKDLIELFKEHERRNPELIILAKVDRAASYATMVDVMDALALAEMKRFSLIPLSIEDAQEVESLP
ncbi:MAG: biopolymer transporter ExbD [Candidatus Eisenbacteria bacterium]|nr:biopolymer transporter ExbD [Candidatus Eisenbacteria bacterium]